jgi:hypothetical protein
MSNHNLTSDLKKTETRSQKKSVKRLIGWGKRYPIYERVQAWLSYEDFATVEAIATDRNITRADALRTIIKDYREKLA